LAGHELATRWCSSCHVVDPGQQRQGTDAVPTFAAIAGMKSTTAASLKVFLATPHGQMPDYALSRDDIADVSAYILSLRK
jgi:mono/diheme cytochrome c family protein